VRKRLYDQYMQFVLSLWWDDYIDGITRSPFSCSYYFRTLYDICVKLRG
jgi:hypothetical protein